MDNRFPYGSPRDHQGRQPPPGNGVNPMELEEALYFQRRQELQRDLQLRQMLLQGQIDRQQNMHQQRMHELQQQFGTQQALANLQREQQNQQLQEQLLRRRQLGLAAATQLPHAASAARPPGSLIMSAPLGSPIQIRRPSTRDVIMADALTSNATRRPANSGKRKRASSATSDNSNGDRPAGRRARKNSVSSQKASHHNDALLLAEASMGNMNSKPRARSNSKTPSPALLPQYSEEAQAVEAFKALSAVPARDSPFAPSPVEEFVPIVKGTIDSLIEAGQSEKKINDASAVLLTLQDVGELSESEPEPELLDSDVYEVGDASDLAVKIDLPGFQSRLPQLPCEPELRDSLSENKSPSKPSPEKKPTEDIEMGKEQDVANGDKQESPGKKDAEAKEASPAKKGSPAKINGDKAKASDVIQPLEYPYPIDTWWPSIPTIRRERKLHGEDADDDKFVDDTSVFPQDSEFHGDVRQIRSRLSTDVQPGVLEKIPHCKIHRLRIKGKKGLNVPDHAFCWQVSEAYCNDVMVCCSICSTWRHAGCGGHYKAISVREQIESKQPFTPICDLCHAEQALLQEYPKGEARLERQRIEQLRRALSTTAIIRQAPFVKFGGTYKWPLGSVSNSHIGGHTRSIHSRHDKAEKTWTEMTNRLSRGAGYRPKERVKVRTKEFERVLVCVEDSEGIRDRHNMIQFLENDCRKERPAGYEKRLRNIFDPDDDEDRRHEETAAISAAPSQDSLQEESQHGMIGRRAPRGGSISSEIGSQNAEKVCARKGCCKKPRFDSIFCSDSCGIQELEGDLLRAMYLAEETHPSLLRTA